MVGREVLAGRLSTRALAGRLGARALAGWLGARARSQVGLVEVPAQSLGDARGQGRRGARVGMRGRGVRVVLVLAWADQLGLAELFGLAKC